MEINEDILRPMQPHIALYGNYLKDSARQWLNDEIWGQGEAIKYAEVLMGFNTSTYGIVQFSSFQFIRKLIDRCIP